MVWFQCEDCGDNLKKPKLPTHFRVCSAYKLSCIDCGQVFGQHDVESHTQCITEAEKYGPKGQAKASNGTNTKPKNDSKHKPDVDINVGLSERPPWFCSLCNTKATSKQTLLLHADGKKHRAKARAVHASKQQPNDAAETKGLTENNAKDEAPDNKDLGESREQNSSKVETNDSKSNKKRKIEAADNAQNKAGGDISAGLGSGEVTRSNGVETEVTNGVKQAKHSSKKEDAKVDTNTDEDSGNKKIKWKKLITSALKSNPDGALKFKKLSKSVVKALEESGLTQNNNQLSKILEQKINSSSRFVVDGKYVRLATSS
ncbi:hypothetical protein BUALT_Bualt16G0047100 [Buddleja alternifolia]|uniref:U1-type domain-containing protein n=1 Tax=Buddleja alternifolia TaxID=168488 RepID=A0AAV6WFD0_9LAMI|nr:hypothetical protein BUALT_Bualt16G0047100 [Buddleja alternifolia]